MKNCFDDPHTYVTTTGRDEQVWSGKRTLMGKANELFVCTFGSGGCGAHLPRIAHILSHADSLIARARHTLALAHSLLELTAKTIKCLPLPPPHHHTTTERAQRAGRTRACRSYISGQSESTEPDLSACKSSDSLYVYCKPFFCCFWTFFEGSYLSHRLLKIMRRNLCQCNRP